MEPGSSKIIRWLIPPACREEVLGDLHEERADPLTALHTVICVILSRIRRTSDPVVVLMEALALFTPLVISAQTMDRALLFDSTGIARLAIPPAATILTLMVFDAYTDSRYKAMIFAVASATAVGAASLPRWVAVLGIGFGSLMILPIRWAFPPIARRPAAGPAYWQKLELPPLGDFVKYVTAAVIFVVLILSMFVNFR